MITRTGTARWALLLLVALWASAGRASATGWEVENASPASAPATFAAGEMQRYLEQTRTPRPGTETENAVATPPRIVVGLRADLAPEDAAHLPPQVEGYDGYAVAVVHPPGAAPTWIVGGANGRGVVYGVYDVLERVGWRWFHPALDPNDPEVRPTTSRIALDPGTWSVASPMKVRTLIWYVSRDDVRKDPPSLDDLRAQIDWIAKTRHNTIEHSAIELDSTNPVRQTLEEEAARRGLRLQSFGHSYDLFLKDSPDAFAAHPEWFGESEGRRLRHRGIGAQFCWTNEGAIEEFTKNVKGFVADRATLDVLTLSPLDGNAARPCECERCASTSVTDRHLSLVNHAARALARDESDVSIETLVAYQHIAELPEHVTPHPNVRGRFAVWQRGLERGYSTDRHGAKLAAWAKVFDGRITACQYYSDGYANPALASVYTKQMKSDRAFLLDVGTDGFLNLLYLEDAWWRSTLNAYLAGRGFYDPTVDFDELREDYALRYHGPSAGPLMVRYYAALAANPKIGSVAWRFPKRDELTLLRQLRLNDLAPARQLAREEPVFHYRLQKASMWHELTQRAALATYWVRRARDHAERDGDTMAAPLAKARDNQSKTVVRAREIEKLGIGILSATFEQAYSNRFARLVQEVSEAASAKSPESPNAVARPGSTPAGNPTTPPPAATHP